MMKQLYDPKCEELARYFLRGRFEEHVSDLAVVIQQAIEDWIAEKEGR